MMCNKRIRYREIVFTVVAWNHQDRLWVCRREDNNQMYYLWPEEVWKAQVIL